jgi:hypothetical protein
VGYAIEPKGKYEGVKIHITYDNNSWTAAAYKGVSLDFGDEDKIFNELFEVDWSYQLHAALELPNKLDKNGHVYAFGETQQKRWDEVQKDNGKDDAWIQGAQAALGQVVDAYIANVKKKIKALKTSIV